MAILTLPEVIALEVAVPVEVFGPWPEYFTEEDPRVRNPYRLTLCGPQPRIRSGDWLTTTGTEPLDALAHADTIVVPGVADPLSPVAPEVLAALVAAAGRGARLVSLCSGAFTLAQAGLLDHRRVTTHWLFADLLRHRFPLVDVQERHLYIDDGAVLSSAGVLAATDLCLYLIAQDVGQTAANALARLLVSPPHRDGGQEQFARRPVVVAAGPLSGLRHWLLAHLDGEHTLTSIARQAKVSVRTLTRRFHQETGTTVMDWLTAQRVARARVLLEDTDLPVPVVAGQVGFGSAETLRAHFVSQTGTSPQRHRRTFRSTPTAPVRR
ncbi:MULTISPECIES: GlxA family transcriptional regulator [unclassified Crossiella]|uniref:GlxA family transcriptional regulator n=1 Tax=unclassified Crossiella TaxID=2620835 RepID=UPI00200026D1|nr:MULTISPECIES: helix-turn-helix domain-containing protein [unclassified Crossiella]MCK2243501.1 helix-turn-helix domain-containing protein [Crossiella sp. S99.2]MCK2257359.1 helix-turn-helix domain-containing protein [Crossiella sp. S99.1]